MPGLSLPLSLTLQLSSIPVADNPLLLPAPTAPAAHSAPLLADLVASAGAAASPYWLDPNPRQQGWTCHGVDNATLDVAARCPLVGLADRLPR